VQVINTATDMIVASIPVGDGPVKMWTAHNGEHVFVSCNFADQVYMINTSTLAVVHVFDVGVQPRNVCTSPDDSRLYSADWLSFTMTAYSTLPPYELIATVPVDYWPQAILATPDDKYVLVANFGFDKSYDHCSVIRTDDWQVIARLQTGAGPEDMVSIGDEGQYLYVSNWGQPCCFYAAYDFCCSSTIPDGTATIIAMPDFDAIVPQGTIPDTIPYINSTLAIVPLYAQYSFGMATHPSGEFVYTVNMNSDLMSVIGFEEFQAPITGESCADAVVLTSLNECIESTTTGYTDNYNEECGFDATGAGDKVYKYSPPASISGTFDMCGSCYDTKLYIYEDVCGNFNSGTAIYCNDDYCGVNGWRSYLDEVTLYADHDYYIVIDGYGATDHGDFILCFDVSCTSDLTQDGIINVSDLLILVAGFGSQYDTSFLLLFLADFGQVCEP
jgi:DNA-binding beta-propeller fold protein YncE